MEEKGRGKDSVSTVTSSRSIFQVISSELSEHVSCTTILLATLILFLLVCKYRWSRQKFTKELPNANRVLFLIAHPDDEVMFFGPVFINLIQRIKNHVYVLCLSDGNFEGQGSQRQGELWRSCKKLGMLEANITMLKFDELKDSASVDWSIDLVTRVVENHVISHSIDTVITFDEGGVSGHTNHVACYKAVKKLFAQPEPPPDVRAFLLESVNIFRKYCLVIFDIFVSNHYSEYVYVVNWAQRSNVVAGMKCHSSQLTWYRYLYLIFSRYIIVNSLQELKVKKAPKKAA